MFARIPPPPPSRLSCDESSRALLFVRFRAQAAGVMAKVGLWVDCTGDMEVLKESIRGNAR